MTVTHHISRKQRLERRARILLGRLWFRPNRRSSNVGLWRHLYIGLREIRIYGDDTTYRRAADFLSDIAVVEDWGCGAGGFRHYCTTGYVGIDGSKSRFADKVVDLTEYTSDAEGILVRHVLEHNRDWERILENAVSSFRKKLCVVIFTPWSDETTVLKHNPNIGGVPDLSFKRDDIVRHFEGCTWMSQEDLVTDTEYTVEHIFFVERPSGRADPRARDPR